MNHDGKDILLWMWHDREKHENVGRKKVAFWNIDEIVLDTVRISLPAEWNFWSCSTMSSPLPRRSVRLLLHCVLLTCLWVVLVGTPKALLSGKTARGFFWADRHHLRRRQLSKGILLERHDVMSNRAFKLEWPKRWLWGRVCVSCFYCHTVTFINVNRQNWNWLALS